MWEYTQMQDYDMSMHVGYIFILYFLNHAAPQDVFMWRVYFGKISMIYSSTDN